MVNALSRKERRKIEQQRQFYRYMKKGAAVMGTTLTAASIASPLLQAQPAEATGTGDLSQVAQRSTSSAFITEIAAHAQPVAQANDLYASVMIAQAIVESGWGTSKLSSGPYHNLFGIKGSYQGKTVYMNTLEYLNGKWVTMKEPFRHYPSYKESFADNAYVIRNVKMGGQAYYSGAWKSNTSSYRDATQWLTGRYATAPNYASTLNTIIQNYNLTRYDSPASGSAGGGASAGSSTNNTGTNVSKPNTNTNTTNPGTSASQGSYTVQSGDSVWLIANKHGITMDQLISWNGIKNNFVYPGQKLVVKKNTTSNTGNNSSQSTNQLTTNNSASSQGNSQSYTVQSGDSVWLIASRYGISMQDFCSWNGIKDNFIYPGQKVIVKKGASTGTTTNNQANNTGTSNQPATNQTNGQTYTVKSGDSVWGVANQHGITMDQLISWNNIKDNFIYPGQKLVVKNGSTTNQSSTQTTTTNTSNQAASSTNEAGNKYYTVKSGESVWLIAQNNHITMDQLISWNNIKDNFIYPGQKLIVQKDGTNAATSTNETTYTVQAGESVWSISNKHGISMDDFIQWNNIKDNYIYPGQKVIVKK